MKRMTHFTESIRLTHKFAKHCLIWQCLILSLRVAVSQIALGQDQTRPVTDVNTPLHAMQPDYDTPYGAPEPEAIIKILDRIYNYLNIDTTPKMIDHIS